MFGRYANYCFAPFIYLILCLQIYFLDYFLFQKVLPVYKVSNKINDLKEIYCTNLKNNILGKSARS